MGGQNTQRLHSLSTIPPQTFLQPETTSPPSNLPLCPFVSLSSHSDTKLKEKGKLKGTSKGNGIVRVREAKSEAVMSGLFPRELGDDEVDGRGGGRLK